MEVRHCCAMYVDIRGRIRFDGRRTQTRQPHTVTPGRSQDPAKAVSLSDRVPKSGLILQSCRCRGRTTRYDAGTGLPKRPMRGTVCGNVCEHQAFVFDFVSTTGNENATNDVTQRRAEGTPPNLESAAVSESNNVATSLHLTFFRWVGSYFSFRSHFRY